MGRGPCGDCIFWCGCRGAFFCFFFKFRLAFGFALAGADCGEAVGFGFGPAVEFGLLSGFALGFFESLDAHGRFIFFFSFGGAEVGIFPHVSA